MKDIGIALVIGIVIGATGMYYQHPLRAQALYNQGMVDTMATVCAPVTNSIMEARKASAEKGKK